MENNKLEISAMSYTNKDFASMYPEILEIAKQLTNEWDPANSNESDPGVVLLKEAAFVADHNNYNIDKNILENFLPSATQDISVRNICEMNGYVPRYYTSAIGDITFTWEQPESEIDLQTSFTIPAFTLVVSDTDETVSYTQIENLVVNNNGPVSCKFIEGTLQTLVVNNSSIITLQDLDDNNRVYFPEAMVAQNRVYVRNYNSEDDTRLLQEEDYWVRDDYLLTRPSGSKVFKFDYDSIVGLPYIEFTPDVSSVIGDGVVIEYIATSGINGNINANTITKILSPDSFNAIGEDVARTTSAFSVYNSGSITNGKNPETISEMYMSFKKIIGTFDTLVTCRDYSNAIYRMEDSDGNPLVSNAYVADRRIDYNKALNVISYDQQISAAGFENISIQPCSLNFRGIEEPTAPNKGDFYAYKNPETEKYDTLRIYMGDGVWEDVNNINLNDFALLTEAMTPYDLVIYALKAFSLSEYTSFIPWEAYKNSFQPVDGVQLDRIKTELELNKCLSHTYNDPDTNDIIIFKNYVPLNVELEPYNKIKSNEELDILNNIYKAISNEFNPRKLEFGEKLDVDQLKKVIIAADSRIKNAKINPLEYRTYAMEGNGKDFNIFEDSNTKFLIDLIAKNVLAGRVCLFNFANSFKFDFGQQGGELDNNIVPEVTKIESELYVKLTPSKDDEDRQIIDESISRIGNKFILKKIEVEENNVVKEKINYSYRLYAPNNSIVKEGEEEWLPIEPLASYTLKSKNGKKDTFELIKQNSDGTIATSFVFESDANTSYTITNSTDEQLINSKTKEPHNFNLTSEDMSIEVNIDVKNKVYDKGAINLDKYTLKENECIQILHDNYISDTVYSTYVNYSYITSDDTKYIPANLDYTLSSAEKIVLLYTSDGIEKQTVLKEGEVVNANFNIYPTENLNNVSIKEWTDYQSGETFDSKFRQLTSNQTIATRKLMQTKLDNSDIWCYWILNRGGDEENKSLFRTGSNSTILGNDEYFIYTNQALNELIILGAGTKIEKPMNSSDSWWRLDTLTSKITVESLNKYGTSIKESVPWKKGIDFAMYPMFITEMSVITLGEGDWISIYGWDDGMIEHEQEEPTFMSKYYLDSNWASCNAWIEYKNVSSDNSITLPRVDDFYQIRSRLDINMSNTHPQMLYTSRSTTVLPENPTPEDIAATITAVDKIFLDTTIEIKSKPDSKGNIDERYIQSSTPMFKVGGSSISLNKTDFYHYTLKKSEEGKIINYNKTFILPKAPEGGTNPGSRIFEFFCSNAIKSYEYILPIHISGNEDIIKIEAINTLDDTVVKLRDYNLGTDFEDSLILSGNQSYYIQLDITKPENIKLTLSWEVGVRKYNEAVSLEGLVVFNGINSNLKPNDSETETIAKVKTRMREILAESDKPSTKFYYPYQGDNSVLMDNINFNDANALWDKNNIVNKMTLPFIDMEHSSIKVISSMKRD